jgi:hypothetical protein
MLGKEGTSEGQAIEYVYFKMISAKYESDKTRSKPKRKQMVVKIELEDFGGARHYAHVTALASFAPRPT